MEANNSKKHVVTHLLLILGSIVMLFPFLWMILSSFKTVGEQMSIPMKILPGSFGYLENYKQALEAVPFLRLYLNTILMIFGRVICAVIFSSMAGYGFARMEFPFKRLLFTLILMQMMVPGQIFIVPQYMMLSKIKLLNTVFALIFPALVSAFGTFLLRQQYMALPKELEEAGLVEGANVFQVLWHIVLPSVKPVVITQAFITFLGLYNSYLWPSLVVNKQENRTVTLGIAALVLGENYTNPGLMMASTLVSVVPVLIIFMFANKYVVKGFTQSGIK